MLSCALDGISLSSYHCYQVLVLARLVVEQRIEFPPGKKHLRDGCLREIERSSRKHEAIPATRFLVGILELMG
ncbi:hypothetical protein HPP92_013933 [Vanilla planifolia]|uniref:Uncharacterized protein n=1 Tax=Vanilla planifolia TaxID=51239 RepID=A0A835UUA6_VANPL|nr:hypothetical protein HPP92_013933 [Vanilla planifolia]